ncbi:MAG: hypothetical protein HFJ65_08255 [Eggerthellaceae bacterium]|nr:hypothetical protein [Eggerthellaceae bacterium]
MDFAEIYHFLFETYAGIGILVGAGIILSILVSIIFEVRTRKIYKDHKADKDEWSIFDDDDEEQED